MIVILDIFIGTFRGITLFPFIILKSKDLLQDKKLINHEKIHLRQQIELLIIPFYIIYLIEYILKGYRGISFEREAYDNDQDLDYLKKRKLFAWTKYFK